MRSGWKQLQNTWRLHERLMYLFVERSIQTVVVRSARYSATINSKSSQVNFPFRTLIKHTDELKEIHAVLTNGSMEDAVHNKFGRKPHTTPSTPSENSNHVRHDSRHFPAHD